MNISGFIDMSAFSSAMSALPKSIKKEVRRDLKEAAEVVVSKARDLAPVDTGHLKFRIRSRQASWSSDGMVYEIVSDAIYRVSSAGPYPSFQEFGTVHNKAHSYLRPALSASKEEVRKIVENSVRIGMEEAVGGKGISISGSNLKALDLLDFS